MIDGKSAESDVSGIRLIQQIEAVIIEAKKMIVIPNDSEESEAVSTKILRNAQNDTLNSGLRCLIAKEQKFPRYASAIAILLLATWLRAPSLVAEGLHADEALFSTWSNWIASGWDIFLQNQVVDKPPVLFYLQAVALQLFDKADFSLHVPNFVASLVLIALPMSGMFRDLRIPKHSSNGVLFALLLALSPSLIQFSGTGFTDPLMLCFGVAGLVAWGHGRFGWSGVLFGLALATKYTAIFLFPLVPILNPSFPRRRESILFLRGLIAIVILLVAWLVISGNGLTGTGDGQLIAGLRVVRSAELLPRLQTWNTHLQIAFGYPYFAIMLPAAIFLHWRGTQRDRYLIAYATLYFAFHWLIATALYDRYMLPLVWMSCLIVARAVRTLTPTNRRFASSPSGRGGQEGSAPSFLRRQESILRHDRADVIPSGTRNLNERTDKILRSAQNDEWGWGVLLVLVAVVTLLPHSLTARERGYTLDRIDIAPIVEPFANAPYGTVVYDHFYSWQLRYGLFYDRAYVEWVPHPDALVENLAVFYDDRRYLVLPDAPIADRFHVALNENGYTLQTLVQSDKVILYQVVSR